MRADRLLTLYFFGPLIRAFQRNTELLIPILMYHSISDTTEKGVHPYYQINTSPARFAEHMKYLDDNKYQVINLSEAARLLSSGNLIDSINPVGSRHKLVVITFDDGFHDFYTSAFPVLSKYGFNATVFLPTGFISKERSSFNEKACMTWDEIRQLSDDGIIFGSHTINHPQLKNLSEKEIEHEIRSSKERIEDEIGITVDSFSYPFAFPQEDHNFVTHYIEELIKQGYRTAVTTTIGRTVIDDNLLMLKRLPVNGADDRLLFQSKLRGAYDWLRIPQHALKVVKGLGAD